jgi:hypothetical protein
VHGREKGAEAFSHIRVHKIEKECLMKRLLIGAVMIGVIAGQLAAQRGGMGHSGGGMHFAGGNHYPAGVVVPPIQGAVPGLGASTASWHDHSYRAWERSQWGHNGYNNRYDNRYNNGYSNGYGGYASDYGYGGVFDPFYADRYVDSAPAPQAGVVVLMPQVELPPPPPPPPPPIQPETREYQWPASASDSSATTFSIVSKDGQVQLATAVWVQDNALCYFTPDGRKGRIQIGSVDRQSTRQRNAENHLNLWLPPEG